MGIGVPLLRLWHMLSGKAGPDRLWIVEKPIWFCYRRTIALWSGARRVWTDLLGFFDREVVSWLLLAVYAIVGAACLHPWLGVQRAIDGVILAVFLFWAMMLAAFAHANLQEQMLRVLPAFPVWFPLLVGSFAVLLLVTVAMFLGSLLLLPLALLAMLLGLICSWWRARHGVTVRCTKGECRSGRRFFRDLQIRYVCPGHCGARYGFLVPSHLGLFYHDCTCGARLPAWGRLRRRPIGNGKTLESTLEKVCPNGHPWGIGSEALPSHFIAMVGGPSTGKTCFLTMALELILCARHGRADLAASWENPQDAADHGGRIGILSQGKKLPATQRGIPDALTLRLMRNRREERLYLYDAAGEEFTSMERGLSEELIFFQDLNGVILLIDPLALPKVQPQVRARAGSHWEALQVSQVPLGVIVSNLRRNVRRFLEMGRSGRHDVPVAVVLGKADFPVVAGRIMPTGTAGPGGGCSAEETARTAHRLCRETLIDWGAENEVVALEADFRRLRYFGCSSLGRTPDDSGRPFVAEGVLAPLFWLLDRQDEGHNS